MNHFFVPPACALKRPRLKAKLWACLSVTFVLILVSPQSSGAPSLFNPKPIPGDLLLPLPCDNPEYQIVFRKVYTHTAADDDNLQSFEFTDGTTNYGNAAIQSPRKCQVRGSFHDQYGSFFYLAKYELTTGQYDAIVNHKCATRPTKLEALAKGGISIDEAREVARLYSDFLQTLASPPQEGTEIASATLPYECYWSFAQRGGLSVSKEQLESDLPYLGASHNLKDYAWGFGTDSANGKIQMIGRKIPNALGLFDMLGNVQEYIDEPFQATSATGLIAQKGGSTVRGGSIFTPFSQMTSSLRTEKKRYTNHHPTRPKDTGMRLMLNVSVTVDRSHLKALEQAVLKHKQPLEITSSANLPSMQPLSSSISIQTAEAALNHGKEELSTPSLSGNTQQPLTAQATLFPSKADAASGAESTERISANKKTQTTEQANSTKAPKTVSPAEFSETPQHNNSKIKRTAEAESQESQILILDSHEAKEHINEYCTVCGMVVQLTELANLTYLNFENRHPFQTFVVFLTNADDYGDVQSFVQRRICATGIIKLYQHTPRITNPVKIELQN